jgi:murein DD-endopeptidase MepM/ murein hydrolase activator NlpD
MKHNYIYGAFGILFILLALFLVLLIGEYTYFIAQVRNLKSLQQEYKTCIESLEHMIQSRMASPEECEPGDEKKKINSNAFILLNRTPDYLKKEALDYIQTQKIEGFPRNADEWLDYTTHLLTHHNKSSLHSSHTLLHQKRQQRKKRNQSGVLQSVPPRRGTTGPSDIVFQWPIPLEQFWLSSVFGPRKKPNGQWGFHHGIDMAAARGTLVRAATDGEVGEAQWRPGYGKTVKLKHNKKYETRYAHLDSIEVIRGQKVKRGDVIGRVGDTGFVRKRGKDASHLHFEVHVFGSQVNPLYFLK